jgi:2,3-bisphosphoglycerate-dependent phosphoglycerate mutase
VGEEQVRIWRRSFDVPPAADGGGQPFAALQDDAAMPGSAVPPAESLKDTIERVLPFYEAEIAPALKRGRGGCWSRLTATACARSEKHLSRHLRRRHYRA